MSGFNFQSTQLEGLELISPLFVPDRRGHLTKLFASTVFADHGIDFALAEELESKSCRNTLRGLHFQTCHSQDKIVRVLYGEIYDVAVDLRPNSPTFGRWQSFQLSAENRHMLYIPKYFAHGFLVLSSETVVHYLCGDCYDSNSESGILWNDPELAIGWPLEKGTVPILSERDQTFQSFESFRRILGRY